MCTFRAIRISHAIIPPPDGLNPLIAFSARSKVTAQSSPASSSEAVRDRRYRYTGVRYRS
jgi:hypothetical protein